MMPMNCLILSYPNTVWSTLKGNWGPRLFCQLPVNYNQCIRESRSGHLTLPHQTKKCRALMNLRLCQQGKAVLAVWLIPSGPYGVPGLSSATYKCLKNSMPEMCQCCNTNNTDNTQVLTRTLYHFFIRCCILKVVKKLFLFPCYTWEQLKQRCPVTSPRGQSQNKRASFVWLQSRVVFTKLCVFLNCILNRDMRWGHSSYFWFHSTTHIDFLLTFTRSTHIYYTKHLLCASRYDLRGDRRWQRCHPCTLSL